MSANPNVWTERERREVMAFTEAIEIALAEVSRTRHRRLLRPIEQRMARKVRRAFKRQGAHLAQLWAASQREHLLTEVEEWEWLPYFVEASSITDVLFREATEEAARAALVAGGETAIADLGLTISFDLQNPRARAYMERVGGDLVTRVSETTRERIRVLMSRATAEGWSYQRTASQIRRLYNGFATPSPLRHIRDRAELIAVTESGNAYEQGNASVVRDMMDSGLGMEKRWLTVGDSRVDLPHCRANESQGWIPARDAFQSGNSEPLAHPGCRCTCLYRAEGTEG